jgi:peptidyl-prolyl cis-trans isomerase SurA
MKLIVSLLAASLLAHGPGRQAIEVDRIVAVVNSDVITRTELRQRVEQVTRQLSRQGTPLPPADVLERQVLERQIVERLQLQLAGETSLRVDDVALDRALGRIADNNRMSMTDFRKALEKDGISWERFRDEVRNEMLLGRVREREVESRIVVSDAEVATTSPTPTTPPSARKSSTSPTSCSGRPRAPAPSSSPACAPRPKTWRPGWPAARPSTSWPPAIPTRRTRSRAATSAGAAPSACPACSPRPSPAQAGRHHAHPAQRRRLPPGQGGRPQGRQPGRGPSQVQQTHARHILIKTSEIVSDADARRRLVDLRERVVQGGASFADLARQHSADISAAKGGDLGWIYPGDTVPEFEQVMDALKPGEISQPVQSPFGWHLIVVEERRVQDVSDDRKRAAARNALRERKSDEAFQDWLRQLRDRAYVEYRLEDR